MIRILDLAASVSLLAALEAVAFVSVDKLLFFRSNDGNGNE